MERGYKPSTQELLRAYTGEMLDGIKRGGVNILKFLRNPHFPSKDNLFKSAQVMSVAMALSPQAAQVAHAEFSQEQLEMAARLTVVNPEAEGTLEAQNILEAFQQVSQTSVEDEVVVSGDGWEVAGAEIGELSVQDAELLTVTEAASASVNVPISPETGLPNRQAVEVKDGVFYTENGKTGYLVSGQMLDFFKRNGGHADWGFPISREYDDPTFPGRREQAFEKGIVQYWKMSNGQIAYSFLNIFDEFERLGVDDWVEAVRQAPKSLNWRELDRGLSWDQIVENHMRVLNEYPQVKDFIHSTKDWLNKFGLPMAIKKYGQLNTGWVSIRMQRANLQLLEENFMWGKKGQVIVANGGTVARESGVIIPLEAMRPQELGEFERRGEVVSGYTDILAMPGWSNYDKSITRNSNGSLRVSTAGTELFVTNSKDALSPDGSGFEIILNMSAVPREDLRLGSIKGSLMFDVRNNPSTVFLGIDASRTLDLSILDRSELGSITSFRTKRSPELLKIVVRGIGVEEKWSIFDGNTNESLIEGVRLAKPLRNNADEMIFLGFYLSSIQSNPGYLQVNEIRYKVLL